MTTKIAINGFGRVGRTVLRTERIQTRRGFDHDCA